MSVVPIVSFNDPRLDKWLDRSPQFDPEKIATVASIIADVKNRGIEAVKESTQKYDAPNITEVIFDITANDSLTTLDEEQANAIDFAINRVTEFHETQREVFVENWENLGDGTYGWRTEATESDDPGFEGQRLLPLNRIGVYVPGGQANYPSSVIMNVIPAKVAGVTEIIVATPPQSNGELSPAVLYALKQCGVKTVIKAGGASAIAAMAFGIEGCPRVDKIVGPGNNYVSEAKRQLWGTVGLDTYAGPSEVAVYIDNPEYVSFAAADLLSQIEHAPDNVGMLLAPTNELIQATLMEVESQLFRAERKEIMRQALANFGVAVVANEEQAIKTINRFAPEHLSIVSDDAPAIAMHIRNCGCVLIGPFTPQSCGDFVSEPSHTLPTSGAARFSSPVNILDFFKIQSISMLNYEDLEILGPAVEQFGKMEGFPAHAFGTSVRLNTD